MLAVCDEMSSWPAARGLKQYEVIGSGQGAREEPIILSISSAGYVNEGPYDELVKRGTQFLLGHSGEERLLPVLYMIDDIEKWDDPEELEKSLPGLGVSVRVAFIQDEIAKARVSLSARAEFITKYCNIKQSGVQAWLPAEWVQACRGAAFGLESFRGHYAVLGVDLSMTTDLSCVLCAVESEGVIHLIAHFWLPEA